MKISKILKNILPKGIFDFLYLYKSRFDKRLELKKLYYFDYKRYIKYAYSMNYEYSYENLRSKITFHYHSLEKGLSNANVRLKFGKTALDSLFESLELFLSLSYPSEDIRFQQALDVIYAYIKFHQSQNIEVKDVEDRYNDIISRIPKLYNDLGGYKLISLDESLPPNKLNFKELASFRHSVRDFGETKVKVQDIREAIEITMQSPSVCNRQSSKVHLILNKIKIEKALKIQNGLRGFGQNLQFLILVTADKQYMNGPHERNQTFVDGGIFFMNLLNSLTYKNIATCALNADFSLDKEREIRTILNIKYSEDLIGFIAIGSFPKEFKVASSPRDDSNFILTIH